MSADFERVAEVFEGARGLSGDERAVFLDEACAGDDALRGEVEDLLGHDAADDALAETALADVRRRMSRVSVDAARADGARVPERIGPFTVVRRLGAGGMGVVYEALQERPKRSVAVKLLRPTLVVPSVQRRFEREAEILGRLSHPGIAQVYETGTCDLGDGPQPYFAMELVEGRPLTDHAEAAGLDARARVALVADVCDAVHHAHTQGIVHRDLKPDNVLVEGGGRARILDFGIAHAVADDGVEASLQTADGDVLGTLDYMAPEQVLGGDAARTPAVDVYALGAILYELLSGRTPHDLAGSSLVAAARVVADEAAPPLRRVAPQVPADVAWIVDAAIAPDLARRYESALALADELRRFLADEPVRARPPSAFYRFERLVRRNRAAAVGVALAFVSLAIGLVVALVQTSEARASAAESSRQARRAAAINEYVLDRILSSFSPLGMGRDVKVVDVLALAAPQIDQSFADDPVTGAAVRITLGRSYYQLGLYEEARAILLPAHAALVDLLGAEHEDTIDAAGSAGRAIARLGDDEAALALLTPALQAAQTTLGPLHPLTLELRMDVARSRFESGDREAALVDARATLADAEAALGVGDSSLEILYGAGVMVSTVGDVAESQRMVQRYIDEMSARHGRSDPRVVLAFGQLAWDRASSGDTTGALELSREAVDAARDGLGADHPTTLFTLATLASLLSEIGDTEEALAVSLEVIDAYGRVFGPSHASTLRVRSNHAIVLRKLYRLDEALELALAVLEDRIDALGPEHADVAISYDVLGVIHLQRDEFDEAEAALEEALAIARTALGERSPEVAGILYSLAALRSNQDDVVEAERMYRELAEAEAAIYGADHPFTLTDRYHVGRMLVRQRRYAEAVEELLPVLADQRRVLEPTAANLMRTLTTLGAALIETDRHAEALPLLREALAGLEANGDERVTEDSGVREALRRAEEYLGLESDG
ncbi:MAG: serine/threonine-protein kinase [Planctomycetota bacterium]